MCPYIAHHTFSGYRLQVVVAVYSPVPVSQLYHGATTVLYTYQVGPLGREGGRERRKGGRSQVKTCNGVNLQHECFVPCQVNPI